MPGLGESFRGFLALLSFLTILPARVHDAALAARHFYLAPLVGLLEGAAALAPLLLEPVPPQLRAFLSLSIIYLISGFSHLEGFADFVDAMASGRRGSEALAIMKQPWRGAVAVSATVLAVLASYASLTVIAEASPSSVVVAQVLSQESGFLLAALSKPPPYQGLGSLFIANSKGLGRVGASVAVTALALAVTIPAQAPRACWHGYALAAAASLISVLYTRRASHAVLGFSTGDVIGFCMELSRSTALLAISAALALC